MNILKNKVSQMILMGLLCSITLGIISSFVYERVKKLDLEKQIVFIDITNKNPLFKGITEMGIYSQYANSLKTLTQELSDSLKYSVVRFQKDPALAGGCHKIKLAFTDNSIFLETYNYPISNQKLMNTCLDNLFFFSFNRLKQKLSLDVTQEILRIKYLADDVESRTDELITRQITRKKKQKKNRTLVDAMCKQIEDVYTLVLTKVKFYSENTVDDAEQSKKTHSENLLSVFNLFQSVSAFNTLAKECDVENMIIRNQELAKLAKRETNLIKAHTLLDEVSFSDVFFMEKLSIITKHQQKYLSKKSVILTFAIFGFVFGVLLIYNFRISEKKQNE